MRARRFWRWSACAALLFRLSTSGKAVRRNPRQRTLSDWRGCTLAMRATCWPTPTTARKLRGCIGERMQQQKAPPLVSLPPTRAGADLTSLGQHRGKYTMSSCWPQEQRRNFFGIQAQVTRRRVCGVQAGADGLGPVFCDLRSDRYLHRWFRPYQVFCTLGLREGREDDHESN